MQSVVRQSAVSTVAPPAHSAAPIAPPLEHIQSEKVEWDASIAAVWRDALVTFCAHAPSILPLAFIGIAGAGLLGLAVSLALDLKRYVHAAGPFATYSGIVETFGMDRRIFIVLLVQSALGCLLASFARGAITHVALHGASFGPACAFALSRMPALLAGTLLYSALIGFGAVGVNVWLRERGANLDLSNVGQKPNTVGDALHTTALRSLNALIPDPGSPIAEFTPRLRYTSFRPPAQTSDDHQQLAAASNGGNSGSTSSAVVNGAISSADLQRIVVASLVALVIGETLLRFRAVAAIQSAGALAPLLRSVWWGMRFFISITIHVWMLRLMILAFSLVFIIFPVAIVQCLVEPTPAWTGMASSILNLPLIVLALALINSMFTAFGAVYDARLYRAMVE